MVQSCTGARDNGEPCRAGAMTSGFCFWHDPEHAQDAAEARRLGGLRRRREKTVQGAYEFEGLNSVDDVKRLLEIAILDTLGLENSVARSRTLASLATVSLKALEVGEYEDRIRALESMMAPRLARK
ncbi:MAG TPA: hypothetical protein VMR52_03310 [Dehalococcoidia bacterium]|nr:hypothetical protein [Dehalococcoidia bacterium]